MPLERHPAPSLRQVASRRERALRPNNRARGRRQAGGRAGAALMEAMLALGLVSFAFSSLFVVYSAALGMVRGQQQTIHATLLLEERCAALRAANWPALSDAARLKNLLFSTSATAEAHLPGLVEEIRLRPYAANPPNVSPLTLRRVPGAAAAITAAAPSSLATAECIRADVRVSWNSRGRVMRRETSLVLALGGTGK